MKHLTDYLSNHRALLEDYYNTMDEIEMDILLESFNCTILKEIRNQIEIIRAKRKAEQEEIDKKEYKNWWEKPRLITPPQQFSKLFIYKTIRWDTIKDDQVKEYYKDDNTGIKIAKRICSNRSNSIPGIIINASQEGDEYKYVDIIQKTSWDIRYYSLISGNNGGTTLKPSEVESFLANKFWIIELRDDQLSHDLQNQRMNAKSGIIRMGDAQQYAEIAKANMEKYKRLAEKKRIEKTADDGIADKVMDYVEKVMQIAERFSKDPMKYSSYEYSIQILLDLISDKRHWDSKRGAEGTDGLMILYGKYLSLKLRLASGKSYKSDKQDFENTKKSIGEVFARIDKRIGEMNLD